ncbi:hypothetical protein [Nonomuraea turcica]|uniref:hypothetical protein n=1 Tax=Nonomuraea sp. G32 TaxID=3067274 RepID=UPI00273C8C3C|nr:hypothetical protein [Nonomuraea sp. G32]MDP4505314.1 hypothetical protein [Nonomuraea sp. G32]
MGARPADTGAGSREAAEQRLEGHHSLGPTSVYRYWTTKEDLVVDALMERIVSHRQQLMLETLCQAAACGEIPGGRYT